MQRRVDHLLVGGPGADDQRQVGLAGFALAELVLQVRERAALLGHEQNARGFAVEPVDQFEEFRLRPRLAQLFDHAKTHAAAAVHGRAGRFVEGNEVLVLQQDGEFTRGRRAFGLFGDLFGHAHRRQAHLVALLHTRVGAGAALVDAHLAAADDAVDMGLGHALEVTQQKVVQPLACGIGIDTDHAHGGRPARGRGYGISGAVRNRFGPYNVFHLRSVL